MKNTSSPRSLRLALALGLGLASGVLGGCHPTSHPVEPSALGVLRPASALEAWIDEPGPVTVETVVGADWEVAREGLIYLDHPKAVAAGLEDGPEPIHIAFHALRHPERGLYLVDTGVERAIRDDRDGSLLGGFVGSAMNVERMKIHVDTKSWIERQPRPPSGVFLTHLHLDHLTGMRDVPSATPVYAGPGETRGRSLVNLLVQPIVDDALAGKAPIRQWRFQSEPGGALESVVDVFGDGAVWAIHVPGHTPGSTAYLARTPEGPVLMVGDACHTDWGWENGVEPGSFSDDRPESARSLARLKALVARHGGIDVRLGHQARGAARATGAPRATTPRAGGASAKR